MIRQNSPVLIVQYPNGEFKVTQVIGLRGDLEDRGCHTVLVKVENSHKILLGEKE